MNNDTLTMIETGGGRRYLYDGGIEHDDEEIWCLEPSKLYVFDQMITPSGEVVSRPIRFDNTPFAPRNRVRIKNIEAWWELDPSSDLSRKFVELKKVNSAQKAGLVLS
jgi:hypothetical protein